MNPLLLVAAIAMMWLLAREIRLYRENRRRPLPPLGPAFRLTPHSACQRRRRRRPRTDVRPSNPWHGEGRTSNERSVDDDESTGD